MTMKYFSEPKSCRLCDAKDLKTVIPLPALSVASPNVGCGPEKSVDILAPSHVCQCVSCGFLQLAAVVNPEYQYKNFLYKTDISLGLSAHFDTLMAKLATMGTLKKGCAVFDIGSNDGSLLTLAKKRGATVLGIDPAVALSKRATEQGIPTYGDFFTAAKAQEILKKHGKMDIIISNNTAANIDDLKDMFTGMHTLLADNGLIVIETQYALDVLLKNLLDVIYHEHISYFSVKPMQSFLEKLGFQLIDAERIAPKGGSIRFIIQKARSKLPVNSNVNQLIQEESAQGLYGKTLFEIFNAHLKRTGDALKNQLRDIQKKTGHAFAYGSSVGCFALLHYFDLGGIVEKVFDDTPLCSQLYVNGKYIPVEKGVNLLKYGATSVAVLAWRYVDAISKKQQAYMEKGGKFFPVL